MQFKAGRIYAVYFDDHVEDDDTHMECVVYGKLIKETDKAITLCCWDLITTCESTREDNRKTFTILKGVITDKKLLR